MNEHLTSLQNPRVKHVVKLRDRRERDRSVQFLVEGYRELLRAVDSGRKIDMLFFCEELFLGENERDLIARIESSGAEIFSCADQVFRKMSYRDRPDGLIAVAPQKHLTLDTLSERKSGLIVVAEAIEKPGNLGTILRSADAAGADALIVCDRCTDIHNPNVVRASVGTLFTVPIVETSGEDALEWLKARGYSILAATPSAEKLYTEVDMNVPIALAVGTEQLGLSELWMKQCDLQVRIPMLGVADSLNVATATTLLLYEAVRQRKLS